MEAALVQELATIPGLSGKVYPLRAPDNTETPYVIYVSSEGRQDKTLQGFQNSKVVPLELNIVHGWYGDMKPLTALVLSKIQSFEGRVIGANGPFIEEVTYREPVEIYEPQVNLYRCVIETTFFLRGE